MTDQTQDIESRINSYLDTIESSVTTAGDFMLEQTPLVVQECLAWYFWESLIYALMYTSCSIVILWWISKVLNRIDFKNLGDHPEIILLVVPFSLGVTSVIMAVENILAVFKVIVAPRVVLLEKISDLMP